MYKVVDLVFGGCQSAEDKEERGNWKRMLRSYVEVMHFLSLNREYVEGEIDSLQNECDAFATLLVRSCGGMIYVTNYFHDIVAGHVVEQSKEWGNLWRYRNEGVEA